MAEPRNARLEIVIYIDTFGTPWQDITAAAEVRRAVAAYTGKPVECFLVDEMGTQVAVPDMTPQGTAIVPKLCPKCGSDDGTARVIMDTTRPANSGIIVASASCHMHTFIPLEWT